MIEKAVIGISEIILKYDGFLAFKVFYLIVLISVFSLFIYVFYKSISKRDLIKLDLEKYNYSKHPMESKFFATIFYLLEYIIIIPFIIILWFSVFSIVMFLIVEDKSVAQVLLISAAVIGSIRLTAYYKEEMSQNLSHLFPFIALTIYILSPESFDLGKVIPQILEVPSLLHEIFSFIIVIFIIEIFLRAFYTIYYFWQSEENATNNGKNEI